MTAPEKTLKLGHSPDPDDAFMFYALARNLIPTAGWQFEHILQDIQSLNEMAMRGELDITAISIHAYPYVKDKYALLNCGASMGDGYGPMVVAREPITVESLKGKEILVPGEMTTAFLVLSLLLGKGGFSHRVVMFDQIIQMVAAGQADAGLIIHEGQLTFQELNLCKIVDLGQWWQDHTGLPLPLGGNAITRGLGQQDASEVASVLKNSIEYALAHRQEAVQHSLAFARDLSAAQADQFVGMYVNKWTLDFGDLGRQAVRELLERGQRAGLVPDSGGISFVM